jgi:hypothetical protein
MVSLNGNPPSLNLQVRVGSRYSAVIVNEMYPIVKTTSFRSARKRRRCHRLSLLKLDRQLRMGAGYGRISD